VSFSTAIGVTERNVVDNADITTHSNAPMTTATVAKPHHSTPNDLPKKYRRCDTTRP
jgi:hypothetical protein